ncbi:MAG: hypothetical protein JSV46_05010, partial [Candidatus Aminicenantes bacterium]
FIGGLLSLVGWILLSTMGLLWQLYLYYGVFLGVAVSMAASSLLIPLVGLPRLLIYLFLLNSFCLLFLVGGWRKN